MVDKGSSLMSDRNFCPMRILLLWKFRNSPKTLKANRQSSHESQ